MQPQDPFLLPQIRRVIITGLTLLGIGLFIGGVGKAASQFKDSRYVYGQRSITLGTNSAIIPPILSSVTSSPAMESSFILGVTSTNTSSNHSDEHISKNETQNNPEKNRGQDAKQSSKPQKRS